MLPRRRVPSARFFVLPRGSGTTFMISRPRNESLWSRKLALADRVRSLPHLGVGHPHRLMDALSEPSHPVVSSKGYRRDRHVLSEFRICWATAARVLHSGCRQVRSVPTSGFELIHSEVLNAGGNVVLRHFGQPARIGSVPCAPPLDPHPRWTGSPSRVARVDSSGDKTLSGRLTPQGDLPP